MMLWAGGLVANEFGVYFRFLANHQFAMKNGFFVFKSKGRAFENKSFNLLALDISKLYL